MGRWRYRRYLVALAVLVVLLGAYAFAGFWAVPHFARSAATDFVRSHYGRTLALGQLRFNPFTLRLDASDVSLPDADGKTLLAFKHLHVDLQLATLWRLAPSFREIRLERPYVRAVIRPGGELNLADLGKGFSSAPQRPAQQSKPLKLYVARFAVLGGSGTFVDRTRTVAFEADFNPINIELRDFSTIAGNGNAYRLTAASPQGERLRWEGTLGLTPLTSRGVFEITDLKARTLWEYVRESVPFEVDSGIVGVRGDYELDAAASPLAIKVLVRATTLTDLGLRPKGETQDYVQLARLEVKDTQLDLARRSVTVGGVRLAGGELKVWLDEQGQLNLLRLRPAAAGNTVPEERPPAATQPADEARVTTPAWTLSAPDIALEGLRIAAQDRQVRPALAVRIAPLNVQVSGFSTAADAVLQVHLDAALEQSGRLAAQARVVPASASVSAHLEADDLALPLLQPYLARYTSMTLLKGALSSRLDLERRADGALEVKGGLLLSGLRTVDNSQRRDFITWKELKVSDLDYRSRPQSLKVKSVTLIEPYARVIVRPDRSLNITEVLTPAGRKAAPEAAPPPTESASRRTSRKAVAPPAIQQAPATPATPFPTSIGRVHFVNARLDYTDLWIKPSFAVAIQTLNGSVTGLSSDPRSRASVQLDGKVERYSPAHIGGEVNLLSAALYTDITMSFKDIDLTIVNPYSGHFMGYKIDKGKLAVDVSYLIEQRRLNAKQHFVIDQLELGERVESPDAVHLPLKLAVALLKDRNGVIDVDLPMSGTLDDPQFRLGPLIWKAFLNLLVKAATAPFALLGHLFGGGEHMNVIEFAPGSIELDEAARQQLSAVAKSLQERPQLKLDVPIVYWAQLDGQSLAAAHLQQQLLARAQSGHEARKHPVSGEVLADPAQHFRLLLEEYRDTLGKDVALPDSAQAVQAAKRKETPPYEAAIADMNAALIARMPVADAELGALGKERARTIQDALLSGGQIDPARVFIVAAQPGPGSGDRVKVELALK